MKHTARVREVAENVAEVETSHGDFGNDHLQEGGEGGEDAELLLVETETGGGTEVTTLHDAGGNEHFGVLLVDDLQTRGALEVALKKFRVHNCKLHVWY